MKMFFKLFAMLLACGFASCSTKPTDADRPGQCALKCSDAVIAGSSNYRLVPVFEDFTATCVGVSSGTTTMRFDLAWKAIKKRDSREFAVGNVSVNVIAGGAVTTVTGTDEWCTDECGVATFTFDAPCPADENPFSASISLASGALFSDPPVSVTIDSDETNPFVGSTITNTTTTTNTDTGSSIIGAF